MLAPLVWFIMYFILSIWIYESLFHFLCCVCWALFSISSDIYIYNRWLATKHFNSFPMCSNNIRFAILFLSSVNFRWLNQQKDNFTVWRAHINAKQSSSNQYAHSNQCFNTFLLKFFLLWNCLTMFLNGFSFRNPI